MAEEKAKKKLPDRARSSHPKHAKRQGHKARAAKRHERNRSRNHAQMIKNNALRELGSPTPWEAAKAARHARRHPSRLV